MQKLTLTRNPKTGKVVGAAIDGVALEGFRGMSQHLEQGCLSATLTADFGAIDVVDGEFEPDVAPDMSVYYLAGEASGTCRVQLGEGVPDGGKIAYALKNEFVDRPRLGAKAEKILDKLVAVEGGAEIPADPGMVVCMCVLDAKGLIVKFSQHTLTIAEIRP